MAAGAGAAGEAQAGDRLPALAGVRVLEASVTRAGRVAGMLLADLGADVVRARFAAPPGSTLADKPAEPDELAAGLLWDRGKRVARMTAEDVARLAGGADVLIVDHTPGRLAELGLDAATLAERHPGLNQVWLPPYGEHGEWREVAEDPLLLAGLGGAAARNPATRDCPVAPVAATIVQLHGALAAAAAVAALLGRRREGGRGHAVTVSGLHAAAAQLGMMTQVGLDQPVVKGNRSGRGVPFWRIYQAGDGRWLYLAALVPEIFFRALDAMDRMDVLVLPGVDGDWNKVLVYDEGGQLVADELEKEFRKRPLREWLDLFASADVPCAPIATRAEWADRDITEANRSFVQRQHPALGTVRMPGFPVDLGGTPATPGAFAVTGLDLGPDDELWRAPETSAAETSAAETSAAETPAAGGATGTRGGEPAAGDGADLPLRGVTIVDLSSYLAGPLIGEVLADWGADVIKVEPPDGDPFRAFPMSVLVASQHKRDLALDIARPGGADLLLRLLASADVLVENMRPGRLEKLGLPPERIAAARPDLVRCSVSAYGHASAYASAPGFDPVFQGLSGLADAQGGDGDPVLTPIPLNDTGTGVLGALGVLAALYARDRDGAGQRLSLSLANTATYLQAPELTEFASRPEPARGATNFPGPTGGHRYYRCADGWIAVAAVTAARTRDLLAALGALGGDGVLEADELVDAVAAAFAARTVRTAAAELAARGVPAVRAVMGDDHVTDEHLGANGFTHLIDDPRFGRFHVVRGYGTWSRDAGRPPSRSVLVGHDTREILAELGCPPAEVEALFAARTVADIDLRDVPEGSPYGPPAPPSSRAGGG
ncbi:CoA transferase [Pseudofrankia saprophytica]|uniref:CoA transferase n=1 Tax=Pseudofrankia saprophytica TaxID=298655 RepID=UPI000234DBA7|nr:CoA transferase [Pseudofrankia saprophytica]